MKSVLPKKAPCGLSRFGQAEDQQAAKRQKISPKTFQRRGAPPHPYREQMSASRERGLGASLHVVNQYAASPNDGQWLFRVHGETET